LNFKERDALATNIKREFL
jgi:hypothetical protein